MIQVVRVWIVITYAFASTTVSYLSSVLTAQNLVSLTAFNKAMAQQEYKLLSDTLLAYKGTVFQVAYLNSKEFIDDLPQFDVRDDDVYLVTFPKSGDNLRSNIWQPLQCIIMLK